ncbi:hypothetical protein OUZ56_018237 [Daphnia magna]|uniref:Uncharacterized protein n=1 Tax=Daphnia magna TaxID=35525 RepID=A0ABQ9Z8D3_9CRUS|nr:hypothetical protein OUZ56_018237 [Daphnia magna]
MTMTDGGRMVWEESSDPNAGGNGPKADEPHRRQGPDESNDERKRRREGQIGHNTTVSEDVWSAEDRNLKTGIGASPEKRRIQAEEQACRRGWPAAELVILDCYDKGPENCVLEASVIRQERLRSGLQEQVSC